MNTHGGTSWRAVVSITIAVVLLLTTVGFLLTTGGIGAIIAAVAFTLVVSWWVGIRRSPSRRRMLWTITACVLAVTAAWDGYTLVDYVFPTKC